MAKRLMDYGQINAEKIPMGRSTIYLKMASGEPRFPQPAVRGKGRGRDLWDEADIDRYLEELKAHAAQSPRTRRSPSNQPRNQGGKFAPKQGPAPLVVV